MSTRAADAVFTRALLEARAPLHLGYRLATRFQQFVAVDGAASAGAGWRAGLLAAVLVDIAVWAFLRRSDRFGLWWRLPLDALDVAVWSLAPAPASPHYDTALLVGFPLAMETGVRRGLRGLAVVPPLLAIVAAVRLVAGRPVAPFTFLFLVLGVAMGAAILRYCQRLQTQADLEVERRRAAEHGRAVLAGQNAVAMGASSVVDTLEGLVPVLGPPAPGSALADLAGGWKARLSQATAGSATYLQVAVLQWERDHNRHPDLSGIVAVHVAEGAGTTLLTGGQVTALWAALDRLGLRGVVPVVLGEPAGPARPPGAALRLTVGEREVHVPADHGPGQRPVDPGPVIFGFAAALTLRDVMPVLGGVPAWAIALGVTTMAAGGRWAHGRLLRRGAAARRDVLLVAAAIGVGYAALAGATMTEPVGPAGGRMYAIGGSAYLIALLAGLYCREMTRRTWLAVGAALGGLFAAHVALRLPASVRAVDLVLLMAWPLSVLPTALQVSRSVARANDTLAVQARAADARVAAEGYRAGQDGVVELVSRARDEARAQLARLGDQLDPALTAVARQRLGEVERRLLSIGSPDGSSLSTTTT